MRDVIIVGAGAAGLSAALWCDELGLDALVLEREAEIGGQLRWVYNEVRNHLGTEYARDGRELRDLFQKQLASRGFELQLNCRIQTVDCFEKTIGLANGTSLSAKNLILATGVSRRKLNVPGEDEFRGRGVLTSGKRDRDQVAGQTVCVVGGGDAAAENALILAEVSPRVYLVHRRAELRARQKFIEQIEQNQHIEIVLKTEVRRIVGSERVQAIELQRTGSNEIQTVETDAVVVRIGVEPNTTLFHDQLKTDENGYLEVSRRCETSAKNVYAVGDAANPLAPTVSGAVGDGATAVKVIINQLPL